MMSSSELRDASAGDGVAKLGLWSSCAAAVAAVAYDVVQLLQIAHVVAPPWDAILIYGSSLCLAPAFLLAIAALHYAVPAERRAFTLGALAFATMYAMYASLNYVVQLATVIPATTAGTLDPIRVLDQTPHSLFWDVDALAYVCMGIATLLASRAIPHVWTRRALLAHAAVTPLIAIVYFAPHFSVGLLFALGLPWALTAPTAALALGSFFRRAA